MQGFDWQRAVRQGSAAAMLLIGSAAMAQDIDSLAQSLAQPKPPECEKKLPDGTCPDLVDTRQLLLGKKTSAAQAPRVIRQDISMTFEKGSAILTAGARATLDRFAKALASVASYRPFTIEGHTDRSGPREVNEALSQARAQAVATYLTNKGVDRSRVIAKGYGYDKPLKGVSPDNPRNRRVEVTAN